MKKNILIPTYFQGDTIEFFITGNDVINFDTSDFKITFYGKDFIKKVFNKSDMTSVSTNKYSGEITGEITATMEPCIYTMRIQIGTSEITTSENNSFTLLKLN